MLLPCKEWWQGGVLVICLVLLTHLNGGYAIQGAKDSIVVQTGQLNSGNELTSNDVSDERALLPPQDRAIKSVEDRHLLVLTMDGTLSCVGQRLGSILWKMKDNPLVQVSEQPSKEFLLIPNPKDGSLFAYDGNRLTKYPFSIPQLVALSPSRTPDGLLYSASKHDVWIAINMTTGEKLESMSVRDGFERMCPREGDYQHRAKDEIAYIGRSEYSLGVFDSISQRSKWSGSYVDYVSHAAIDVKDYELRHFGTSYGGVLATVDEKTGSVLWTRDFSSPVAALFLLDQSGFQRVPLTTFVPDLLDLLVSPNTKFSQLNNVSFRDRTKVLAPNIELFLYVGASRFGTYTMPTLGIRDNTLTLLPEGDARMLIAAGAVTALKQPDQASILGNDPKYLQGYYNMPQHSEVPIIPIPNVGYDRIFQTTVVPQIPGLPGPNESESTQPVEKNGGLVAFLIEHSGILYSTFLATVMAILILWNRRRNAVVISASMVQSSAQTSRMLIVDKNEDGHRVFHVGKLEFYPETILGYGSAGTIVYEGRFDGRKIAVKRLVPELVSMAEREARLLRLSDQHPNVIRYFTTEMDSHFCYLAFELAAGTLADYVEGKLPEYTKHIKPLEIIEQSLIGLRHLHELGIIHRDLKPANILLSLGLPATRALISDFGLCKRISNSASSTGGGKASSTLMRNVPFGGTEGWVAPEILGQHLGEGDKGPVNSATANKLITEAVDIFSCGCLLYYALTSGKHPFGEPLRRQSNIQQSRRDFFELLNLGNYTAKDLAEWMVLKDPSKRPTVSECLMHPTFWSPAKQLAFLLDVSDRLEKEPSPGTNNNNGNGSDHSVMPHPALVNLERNAAIVCQHDWRQHVGKELQAELRNHRTYRGNSVRDLLRAIRNKKNHYQEMSPELKAALGRLPDEFVLFFTKRFPQLVIHTYRACNCLKMEPQMSTYYHKFAIVATAASDHHSTSDITTSIEPVATLSTPAS